MSQDFEKLQSKISLRPLVREDFGKLVEWLNAPHVAKWWDGAIDRQGVIEKYELRLEANSPTKIFVIELSSRPVGFIQCYRHNDYPEWERDIGVQRAAGIDYLIGEFDCVGKGVGSEAIRAITRIAFDLYADIDIVVSAPQMDNNASWRALEKAGFARLEERKLDSDCPSDAGISYIYGLSRNG